VAGDPRATPQWIAADGDSILATVERLHAVAIQNFPGSDEFLDPMARLPTLLGNLDQYVGRADA
jgi:hypothetical protein